MHLVTLNDTHTHTHTHTHIYTHSAGLPWTRDQPAADASKCSTHSIHKRQTSMPPDGFEPAVPAGKRPQTYASDRAVTEIGENATHSAVTPLMNIAVVLKLHGSSNSAPPPQTMLVMAYAVVQLVQAMRCKQEGRGFDWDFSLT